MTDRSVFSRLAELEFDGWLSLYDTPAVDLLEFGASPLTPEDLTLLEAEELLRS